MKLQPAYKETRKEMPTPMVPQLDFIQKKLTALLGFKNISLPNTEADDLMGCYAVAACKRKIDVVLATNDKDLYQLVDFSYESLHDRKGRPRFAKGWLCPARRGGGDRQMGRPAKANWRRARHFGRCGG